MNSYFIIKITIHLLSFILSFYALSGVRFDRFMDVKVPIKAQLLLLFTAMGLGYLVAQFILALAF